MKEYYKGKSQKIRFRNWSIISCHHTHDQIEYQKVLMIISKKIMTN